MEAQGALSPQPLLEDGGVIAPSQMRTRAPCPTPTSLSLRVEGRARGREGARSACGTVCWEGCGRRAPTSSDGSPPPWGACDARFPRPSPSWHLPSVPQWRGTAFVIKKEE